MSNLKQVIAEAAQTIAEYECERTALEISDEMMELIYKVANRVAKETLTTTKNYINNM